MTTHTSNRTLRSRSYQRMLLVPTLVLALGSIGLAAPATADPDPGAPGAVPAEGAAVAGSVITPRKVRRAVAEIKGSGAAYEQVTGGGQDFVVIPFGSGSTLALPDTAASTDEPGPEELGGGGGLFNPYVSFNRTDQSALIAGGGAALAGAICLIPAVGQVACVVAASLVAIATVYVGTYGRCPTSRPNLRTYVYRSDRSKNGCYR